MARYGKKAQSKVKRAMHERKHWLHPIEGMLAPDKFLPIAEETGMIVPITRWTIRTVCVLASGGGACPSERTSI